MDIFLTIIAGVLTFVFGQIIVRLYLEPIQAYRSLIGEISVTLINYGILYLDADSKSLEKFTDASLEIRKLASRLEASTYLIPNYRSIAKILNFPTERNIFYAATNLINISNSLNIKHYSVGKIIEMHNQEMAEEVRALLKIYVPRPESIISKK